MSVSRCLKSVSGVSLSAVAVFGAVAACSDANQGASAAELEQTSFLTAGQSVDMLELLAPNASTVLVSNQEDAFAAAVEAIDRGIPLLVDPTEEELGQIDQKVEQFNPSDAEGTENANVQDLGAVAKHESSQEVEQNFPVIAGPGATVEQVATARAMGYAVDVLTENDPRESAQVMAAPEQPVLAFGDWNEQDFAARHALAKNGEVPGGGGVIYPGRRMIALYGHPSGPALGVLGEQGPEEAVARVEELVAQYIEAAPEDNVMPAFEIIATVASSSPGLDGDYSNESEIEELRPYVDAIGAAGGYAVLDLQPGQANFLDQAKRYEELLALPHVGLALDPEWRIGPDEQPLQRIGSVDADEVNAVGTWLADFTKERNLPQKLMVIHQFKMTMLERRELIDTSRPELAWVLHADGHGTPEEKFDTWRVMQEGLQPGFYMAWKNFIDEDTPTFTPAQTYDVSPRPWFVSYQ